MKQQFDCERARLILEKCIEIFGEEGWEAEVTLLDDPCPGMRISYEDVSFFFKCYKFC